MLTEKEIKEFSKVSGDEGLIKILNKNKSDLIRLLYSKMAIKNKAFSYLVDKGLMSDIWGYFEPLQKIICNYCKHFYGFSKCKAFPNGIPDETTMTIHDANEQDQNYGSSI
jgi:hypothetical protein